MVDAVEVLICVTCKSTDPDGEGARPGARLYDAFVAGGVPDGVTVRAVDCLSNCTRSCTVALRGPDRWTYVYGNLDPDSGAEILRDGAARYQAAADGLVPWRERSQHFRKNCIARIPPLFKETPHV